MQFLPIFSSLLISLALVSTSNAYIQGQHINHNANARHHSSHARMLEARELYHANGISRARDVNGSRKMVRKATKEQIEYQQKFDKMNSEWQAAAQESLKNGQTPQDYASFSKAHGGVSSGSFSDGNTGSGSSSTSSSSNDDGSSKSDVKTSEKAAKASQSNNNQKQKSTSNSDSQSNSNANSDSGSQNNKSNDSSKSQQDNNDQKDASQSKSSSPKNDESQNKNENGSKSNSGNDSNSSSSNNSGSSSNSGSGILGGLKNIISGGDGTFYNTGLGSCGETDNDSDYIVALSAQIMNQFDGGNPNNNPLCGKKIKIEYKGKEVEAQVKDTCPPCAKGSVDMSPAVFNQLALPEIGRIHDIKWAFLDGTQV